MANEQIKAAAQKELLRRKAKAELERRRGISQQSSEQALPWYTPFTSIPSNAMNIATGFGEGVADQVKKLAMDPRRLNPAVSAYQDISALVKPVVENPQAAYDAAKQGLDQNFGTSTRAWNTLATHPVDVAMALAPGIGQLGKAAELGGMSKTANALKTASAVIDPANAVVKPVEYGFNAVRGVAASPPAGQTRMSAALLRKTLPKDLSMMDKLGPEAMLLDASPSMTGLARGVSSGVGPGTDQIVNALMAREAGKSGRLQKGATQIFGPGRDPNAMAAELRKAAQTEARPFYDNAKNNTPEFRSPQLETILAHQLTNPAKGMTESARNANLKWMNQIDDALLADTPQDAASRLHGLRQELDNITNPGSMATPEQKNIAAAAQNARNAVDDILKNRIPGFAEGDAAYAKRMKQSDAFQYGYDSLEGGKSAVWPETFQKDVLKMPKNYVAQGQASRIANAMGTQANDLSAVRKMIGGDGDFNRAKLAETFGPQKVDKGVAMVDAEGAMSQNFADIVRNSKTAQSQSAAKLIESNTPFKVDAGMTTLGMGAKITSKVANALLSKVAGRVSSTTSEALAKALVGDKPTAEALLRDLSKTKNVSLQDKTIVRALLFSSSVSGEPARP